MPSGARIIGLLEGMDLNLETVALEIDFGNRKSGGLGLSDGGREFLEDPPTSSIAGKDAV